jgi:DNA polymerase type B, organellar and viral
MNTWQVDQPRNAARFLRSVVLQTPSRAGLAPLNSLDNTNVLVVFNQLAQAGLPFRIRIYVEVFGLRYAVPNTVVFNLPPVEINPRGEQNNSFEDFVRIVKDSLRYKIGNMEGQSEYQFQSIKRMDFTFVASNNLAALQARLPPLAGGAQVRLPDALSNKRCCVNPPLEPTLQCLRMCFIAHFHKLGHHSESLAEYTTNRKGRGKKPKGQKPEWKEVPIDISALPLEQEGTSEHLDAIEQANPNVAIFVYGFIKSTVEGCIFEWFPVMLRPAKNRGHREHEIILLNFSNHWLYVKDFQSFMCQEHNNIKGETHKGARTCHRCMDVLRNNKALEAHLQQCRGESEGLDFVPKVRLPSEKKPADKCKVQFKDMRHNFMRPIFGAADLELFYTSVESKGNVVGENQEIAAAGVHFVGQEGFVPDPEFQCCMYIKTGVNVVRSYHAEAAPTDLHDTTPFREFMRTLLRCCVVWGEKRRSVIDNGLSPEEKLKFQEVTHCEGCGVEFDFLTVQKCRDHDHLSGKYRAALCDVCNKKAKQPVELLILTHNGTGYDHHYYLRGLADFQNGPDGDLTLSQFTGLPLHPSFKQPPPIREWKSPDVLGESCEKIRCIQFGTGFFRIKFIDSFKFWTKGLESLVNDQLLNFAHKDADGKPIVDEKGGKKKPRRDKETGQLLVDVEAAFPDMINFHPDIANSFEHERRALLSDLCRKLPFPYKSMKGPECFSLPAVLDKEAYYDDLKDKEVADEDYQTVQLVSRKTNARTFLDSLVTYFANDLLQLASIVSQQRKAFYEICGLDPLHYLGMPGAAFQACLKLSGVTFKNITKECMGEPALAKAMMNDIQENIRGGLSCAFIPLIKANFPGCKAYDENKPQVYIGSLDATNLYGFCMKQPLPLGDYAKVDLPDEEDAKLAFMEKLVADYTDDSETGYMVKVDFHVPEDKHDFFDFAPVSQRKVAMSELSIRQRAVKFHKLTEAQRQRALKTNTMPKSMLDGCPKLVPDLGHRTQGLHIAHLKLLLELGIRVTKVHRIWSFRQGRVLSNYIDMLATRRRNAIDESTKSTIKLIANALYGKFLERKERGRIVKIHNNMELCRRAALKKTCGMHVKIQMLKKLPTGETSFMGMTAHHQKKAVVLDTPRIVGWAILEYARRHMYNFYYNVLKKIYGDSVSIAYMDTDSIHYRIQWPHDPAEDMHKWNVQCLKDGKPPVFDLSEFKRFKESCRPFAGTVGLFKHEQGDRPMVEAAYAASKMYAYCCEDHSGEGDNAEDDKHTLRGKGVPGWVLEAQFQTMETYKEAILTNNAPPAKFRRMRSKDHVMQHQDVTKVCLTGDNDKAFLLSPYQSRPLGHYKNNLQEALQGWQEFELEEDWLIRKLQFEDIDMRQGPPLVDEDECRHI